jgi:hypothetical protein
MIPHESPVRATLKHLVMVLKGAAKVPAAVSEPAFHEIKFSKICFFIRAAKDIAV